MHPASYLWLSRYQKKRVEKAGRKSGQILTANKTMKGRRDMAKRAEQNRALGSRYSSRVSLSLDHADRTALVEDEDKATEIIEVAIDDIRLIASAFEIIDLSFQQFPDKFSNQAPVVLNSSGRNEGDIDPLEEKILLH